MEPNSFQSQDPTFENATSQSQALVPKIENPRPKGQSKIQNLALVLLLLLYLITAFAYAALAPLTTGPDELAHYEYVRFIAEHGRLPLNAEERRQASYKSDQPPLYYLLAALPASLVDPSGPPFLKRYNDHPRRQLIERTRHAWGLYNTEDERWPYRAEILRWHTGRWVAILFGAATVAMTFFIARDVFSSLPPPLRGRVGEGVAAPLLEKAGVGVWPLALLAAAVVAFIPRFGLTGSMLNYETTVAFFAALFLWTLLRIANGRGQMADSEETRRRRGEEAEQSATHHAPRSTPYTSRFPLPLLLGLFAGLAILTKLSALILLPEIVVAFWLIGRAGKTEGPSFTWLRGAFIALAAALIVLSLWFGFVLAYFNTVAADGLWVGLLRPLVAADASDATTNRLLSFLTEGQAGFTGAIENLESGPPWEWARIAFRTFWLVPIETVQPLAPAALVVALALCLFALFGLLRPLIIDRRPPPADRRQTIDQLPTPYSLLLTPYSRLTLSLLALHLLMPAILPLLRYAVTFSLADTAQGRHILFSAAPAFAILLVWGLRVAASYGLPVRGVGRKEQRSKDTEVIPQALRFTLYALRPLLLVLLLLIWTAAHLWTMTWAYLTPLPVSTLPQAEAQAAHVLERPLNKFVTLAGYTSQLDPAGRVLRLDLIWQATALSPVDYLTEVSLVDAQDKLQVQWLGYSAGGRYPTRAWDVGDVIRDTVWLPVAGLAAGSYQLKLKLIPTSQTYPPGAEAAPLVLSDVTLPETALRTFNGSLAFADQAAAASGYSIWQNGQALFGSHEFRYRETVLITFSPLLPDQQRAVRIIGPDPDRVFAPVREFNDTALFIVGPDWPGGNYHLQVALTSPTADPQQVNSSKILTVVDRWERQFTLPALPPSQGGIKGGYVGIEANFANQVKLLGYDLGANRAEPGGGIPLTLYWQGLDWLGSDYTIFTKLIAANPSPGDGASPPVYGGRDRLPQEGYRTLYWAPGEIVADPFGVPVEANAPDGVYYLHVGLYQQVEQGAVSLPLVQDGQPVDATSVTIGPIKVGGPPPGTTLTTAAPQTVVNQPFGDGSNVTLLGYDLARGNCQQSITNPQGGLRTCQLSIKLYWRSEAPLPLDYNTFVHLRNAAGETVAQKDQPPLNGAYPTSLWDPGEIIADTVTIPLPADLPAGTYPLVAGLYDFNTGQRLAAPGSTANEVSLTSVQVP